MAGRPKKPVEMKKLEGTYRKDRDEQREIVQDTLVKTPVILNALSVSCPKSITDKYCRKYWKTLTKMLLSIHVLSAGDLPQLETMFVYLQKLREVQADFVQTSVLDEEFDLLEKRYTRLSTRFDQLASKYYVSPADRAKLKIDELSIVKSEQEIKKNESAIGNLLQARNNEK